MAYDNSMSEDEFIAQANRDLSTSGIETVLEACEEFYGSGFHDGVSGDAETFGHFYRVHRFIVHTDSQGFKELVTYDNEDEAVKEFERLDKEYADTFSVSDPF